MKENHLHFGGHDMVAIARQFGTPLYIYNEAKIREQCRSFVNAFSQSGFQFQIAYASKAFCVKAMCQIANQEGLALDVVSEGELYTALESGFPAERIHFHGNNKTIEEMKYGIRAGIGCFVVDNFFELTTLQQLALANDRVVNILLRLTPGVEAHTHQYISTGQLDSKFGFEILHGTGLAALKQALDSSHLNFLGVHVHIGSQIFEGEGFRLAIEKVSKFVRDSQKEIDYELKVLNVGGGFGIRYTNEDDPKEISYYVRTICESVEEYFSFIPYPEIWVEPGRSIVGEAGVTLYTIGSTKKIPDLRTYVAVDGGMTDNLRPALYQAKYEAVLANKMNESETELVSIAGKCCESGDMLLWDAELPSCEAGDVLAVFSTGAYHYSMANNYNRMARPAVVFLQPEHEPKLVVRRETLQDLVRNDLLLPVFVEKE